MKAQVINKFGDTSVFETIELPRPLIKPGYVLIKVLATSVNPVDCKLRSGDYPQIVANFPSVLHGDVAGVIEEIGDGVSGFNVGDEVYGCAGGLKGEGGALAEFMLADARLVAKKPRSLSMSEAAALPLVVITAWEGLFDKAHLTAGKKVLVHGGTGGVGHVAIQLAKWAGAEVYATVSSSEKADIVRSLGVTDVIDYRKESVQDYVNRVTNGNGFDVVFDTVGGDNIDKSIEAVSIYGQVVTILGNEAHDVTPLKSKSASLHIVFMLLPMLTNMNREHHGDILARVAKLTDEGFIKPLLDKKQFTMSEIGSAHARLESGNAIGKVVVSQN